MHEQSMYDDADVPPDEIVWNEKWHQNIGDLPVYTFKSRMDSLPNAVEYPTEEILEFLPFAYLENTIAYMMALAIYEEVDVIGLWGVHMRGAPVYEAERPSITYLTGLAHGKGIEVYIPPGCPLVASCWEMGRYGVNSKRRPISPQF